MEYAKEYATKKEALNIAKRAIKKMKFVNGIRGGKIKSSQAKIYIIKGAKGYVPIAKRK